MGSSVTSLQLKLTFQKTNLKYLILIGILIFVTLLLIILTSDSCGIQHMLILNEINSYENSLDPEFCEIIIEKIDMFNDSCEPEIEILDCG